ncbi:MAG: indole-3-glycerol phosphate synthase TrpC [Endomicrobia bacterium]|nr:indole-3-glycerol phosphate synthase TrpC [Endomicrobiia bacterium]
MDKNISLDNLHSVVKKILEKKKEVIEQKKSILPQSLIINKLEKLNYTHRNFKDAVKRKPNRISIIGECKKATPVRGIIREDYNLEKIAEEYYNSNLIDAISVLTEESFFNGDIYHLIRVRESVPLAVLRKDFVIDEYQIYESLYYGADAILLISCILMRDELRKFYSIAKTLSLEVIFEVHTEEDIKKVLDLQPEIIGINNRDLSTFYVNLATTEKLRKYIPEGIVVISESGISSKKDIDYIKSLDIDAVLIGTYFMQSKDIKHAITSLININNNS